MGSQPAGDKHNQTRNDRENKEKVKNRTLAAHEQSRQKRKPRAKSTTHRCTPPDDLGPVSCTPGATVGAVDGVAPALEAGETTAAAAGVALASEGSGAAFTDGVSLLSAVDDISDELLAGESDRYAACLSSALKA